MDGGISGLKEGMKMKKICTLFLLLVGTIAYADEASLHDARAAWARDYFAKKGGPVPDGGVTILPEKQMSQYNRFKDERIKSKKDILKYGYISKEEPKVKIPCKSKNYHNKISKKMR